MAYSLDFTKFTKEDYEKGQEPYAQLYAIKSPFEREQIKVQMAADAASKGYNKFNDVYKQYLKTVKGLSSSESNICPVPIPDFVSPLIIGNWIVETDEPHMVYRTTERGQEVACPHLVIPVGIYVDVDSGLEKVELLYYKRGAMVRQIFDRSITASATKIVQLAAYGISVTSESAKTLVRWLSDVESYNSSIICEERSVGRLGYTNGYGFSPYAEGLVYDGDHNFKDIFDSVTEHGDYDKWLALAKEVRRSDILAPRIILAASFASVLIEPLQALPFFVHLYGGSGNGKTVTLQLAASVWGKPTTYVRTFNSTSVGLEMLAGFLHNLPLCLDELQIQRTNGKDFDNTIYLLAEGIGRTRGGKTGGVRDTVRWRSATITTGETPIVTNRTAGGAINRVIELDTTDVEHLFRDDANVVRTLAENYGFAGKHFIDSIEDQDRQEWIELKEMFVSQLTAKGITDKQALSGSAILLADTLINDFIFKDGCLISIDEMAQYLKTTDEVSEYRRAYEWLQGWIAMNSHKFEANNPSLGLEAWGRMAIDVVYIVSNKFDEACSEASFSPEGFKKWLKRNDYTMCDGKHLTTNARIGGNVTRCIAVKLLWNKQDVD